MNLWTRGLIFYALIVSATTSPAATKACFREHLKEAIHLNQQRLSFYSELSNGESEKISEKLIQLERGALTLTYTPIANFDNEFQKILPESKISPMCQVFVSMSLVPQAQKSFLNIQSIQSLDFNHENLKSELATALQKDEIKTIYDLGKKALADLSTDHRTFCMSRHLIESMTRSAGLYFEWKNQVSVAQKNNLLKKTKQLLNAHRLALGMVNQLDREALPLQLKGIPIICQDVPAIPIPEVVE